MIAGTGACRRCVASNGFTTVDELGVDPELVVHTLDQVQARREAPGELREHLVLLVRPRERRIGPGLAVVIAEVLVSGEEPEPIAHRGPAKIRGDVAVFRALVSALPPARTGIGSSTGWLVNPAT